MSTDLATLHGEACAPRAIPTINQRGRGPLLPGSFARALKRVPGRRGEFPWSMKLLLLPRPVNVPRRPFFLLPARLSLLSAGNTTPSNRLIDGNLCAANRARRYKTN